MITISFHAASLLTGLFVGFLLGVLLFTLFSMDDHWKSAFSDGWDKGYEYRKQEQKGKADDDQRAV